MSDFIRLHISPFSPVLLPIIVPATVLPSAHDISFHTLQAFPERPYGYMNLPAMEANKIKKKLNGSILKGSKVRIEEAKPKRNPSVADLTEEGVVQTSAENTKQEKGRKRKRVDGVIPAIELPEERSVKRGWTDPEVNKKDRRTKKAEKAASADEKKPHKRRAQPSVYTDQAECLFNTKVPPNAVDMAKDGKKKKKLGKGKGERDVVVHEFANTTKHATFLREEKVDGGKATKEYVEGQGWVNTAGEVVEPEKISGRRRLTRSSAVESPEMATSKIAKMRLSEKVADEDDETSSSGTSSCSEEGSSESSEEEGDEIVEEDETMKETDNITHGSGGGVLNERPPSKLLHPLEALYKRPRSDTESSNTARKPNLELKIPFSFFGDDPDLVAENEDSVPALRSDRTMDGNTTVLTMPQTPFTQRDMQFRGIRSAAPTPDTAAPNKLSFGRGWGTASDLASDEDDQEEQLDDSPAAMHDGSKDEAAADEQGEAAIPASDEAPGTTDAKTPKSDFEKWFWEHRGENNRAWKRRRRDAGKEKRQRENKRRVRKAI